MPFPENLKRIRIDKGLTQKQLAEAIDVTRPTITAYESGWVEPSIEKLLMLSATLQVTVDELLKYSSKRLLIVTFSAYKTKNNR